MIKKMLDNSKKLQSLFQSYYQFKDFINLNEILQRMKNVKANTKNPQEIKEFVSSNLEYLLEFRDISEIFESQIYDRILEIFS